jgi:hypothetical protein
MRGWTAVSLALALAPPTGLGAQESSHPGRAGPRSPLPLEREIALARSAAPPAVSDSATVYAWTDTGYVRVAQGSTGVACYVSRSWPTSLEPHCFDPEGAATIMRIHMREVELLHRGGTVAEARRQVGAEIASGALRLPRRPALSYMMSAAQQLINDDGQPVGRWKPHLMIYYPFLTDAELGLGAPNPAAAMLAGAGSSTSSIVVVVSDFVAPGAAPARP